MAFPTNPTNGQQTTINGIIYTYNSTLAAWAATTTTGSNISGNNITVTDQVSGANIAATGIISAAGNITGGNLTTVGITSTGSLSATSTITSGSNISGSNISASGNIYAGTTNNQVVINYNTSSGVGVFGPNSTGGTTSLFIGTSISGSYANRMSVDSSGNVNVLFSQTISNSLAVGATTPSGTAGQIRATNSITAFYSDKRLKKEICRIENALDKIDKLTGVIYTQNELAEQYGYYDYEAQVGLYTQDVELVQPEAVKPAPFDIAPDGSSKSGQNYKTLMYERLVPLLVEGIKELRQEIKELKGKQ